MKQRWLSIDKLIKETGNLHLKTKYHFMRIEANEKLTYDFYKLGKSLGLIKRSVVKEFGKGRRLHDLYPNYIQDVYNVTIRI